MNAKRTCQRNMVEAWRLGAWERVAAVVYARRPVMTLDEIAAAVGSSVDEVRRVAELGAVANADWQARREAARQARR